MIVEIAVATGTHPGPWFLEDEATIATVVEVLHERADAMNGKTKKPKGGR